MSQPIVELIRAYNSAAEDAVRELRSSYPPFRDAMSLKQAEIPRQGTLASGRTFSFHEIGCCFEKDGVEVDVDFGPNGRSDGFDAWRLHRFSANVGQTHLTYYQIQIALDEMLRAGEIVKSDPEQLGSHLLFWRV
jgi:hypothetical protein